MSDSLKKTILGVISLLASIAVALGVLSPEEADAAQQIVVGVVEHVAALILAVGSLVLIFTGDKNKE